MDPDGSFKNQLKVLYFDELLGTRHPETTGYRRPARPRPSSLRSLGKR